MGRLSFNVLLKMSAHILITLVFILGVASSLADKVELPEKYLTDQLKWAESGKTPKIRADRLEAFWHAHLPRENGGKNPEAPNGYEDGTHVCCIIGCAWQLTRAYIESGQKEKALEVLDWLAKNESKTGLAPIKKTGEQVGAPNPLPAE